MNTRRYVLAALAAACLVIGQAFAGDPSGKWKWSTPGRDGQMRESTAKLALAEGKLTGTVSGGRGGENAIGDGQFANDEVSFTISMTMGERSVTMKFHGKLEGDTIVGTVERPGRDGNVRKTEWKATRAPAAK